MKIHDYYVNSAPSFQNALDIFNDEWASKLPGDLSLLNAGNSALFEDSRINWAVEELGGVQGKNILELGPLEGGHTYMLEKWGAASITAVEANTRSYMKCLIVKEVVSLQKARFLCGDCIEYLRGNSSKFDICFSSGILYHMSNPAELISLIAQVSDRVFIWTHYYDADAIHSKPHLSPRFPASHCSDYQGFKHTLYRQDYQSASLDSATFYGGTNSFSHWMSREDILSCLRYFGFTDIRISFDQLHTPSGPCFAVVAMRSPAEQTVSNIDLERVGSEFNQGSELLDQGKLEEAIATYDKAIEINPNSFLYHQQLGEVLAKVNRLEEAITSYGKAIELNPDFSWSHHQLGAVFTKLNRLEEAITSYGKAIELNPDFSWSHHQLGDALAQQQQWEEAATAFSKAIELNPEHYGTYVGLGKSLAKLGQLDEAIAAYGRAKELNPDADWINFPLAEVLEQKKQSELALAIASCQRAIELNPEDTQAYHKFLEIQPENCNVWLQLAETLAQQNKLEEAIGAYHQAIQLIQSKKQTISNLNLKNNQESAGLTVDFLEVRRDIAVQYLKGEGIEVGALHAPLQVPEGVKVHYVDRMSVSDLRKQYPELGTVDLVEADIVDNGETLSSIADNSWDFAIANHMIEHCQNPMGALENFLRVVKPGGLVYMGVPDKRYTFDINRPLTSLDHLVRDYNEGPEWSRLGHYEEYVRLVDKSPEEQVAERVQHFLDIDYSIHFHVWTAETFPELLAYGQKNLSHTFEIELLHENSGELIVILRKSLKQKEQ